MTLTTPPNTPELLRPHAPFLLTAWWPVPRESPSHVLNIAASVYPGAHTHEYRIAGLLADQVRQVEHSELPIALTLRPPGEGAGRHEEWAFDYLGGPSYFQVEQAHSPPVPRSPAELHEGEEAMLRESLGIPDGEPIPEPQGPLPASEQPEEPFRFDPTPHMDLGTAEPAPDLPPPAPPGPTPEPNAQTSPMPHIPAPKRAPGSLPQHEPFPH